MDILTHGQAWELFYAEIYGSDYWHRLTQKERDKITIANCDYKGNRKAGNDKVFHLGFNRAKAIIEAHQPGRFQWIEGAVEIIKK